MRRFPSAARVAIGLALLGAAITAGAQVPADSRPEGWQDLRKGLKEPPAKQAAAGKPKGWSDQSYYLAMRDGVRLALSFYFPGHVAPTQPAPTLFLQTRYGRADAAGHDFKPWLKAGYAIAVVDTRGSTSSYGTRKVDIGPEEVHDMEEIIAHVASRPWSNGKVIAWGFSYLADTADWATSRPAPALIAAVPRETDFDAYLNLFFPGGVANDWFLWGWGENSRDIDLGRDPDRKLDCRKRAADCAKLFPTLQPVDGDERFRQLRAAMANRQHWGPEDYARTSFRDEPGKNGYILFDSSPAHDLAGIRRQRKPVQYWGSWMDAGTAEAALARFRSAPEVPQEIWITANNHSQRVSGDPLVPQRKAPLPSVEDQVRIQSDFQDRVLHGQPVQRSIHYYVLGADTFRETATWPPSDMQPERLALDASDRLSRQPARAEGTDRYEIDFAATTGTATRWSTQGGAPPAYPDRKEEDRRLKVYDASAETEDMEIAGTPVVTLRIAASFNDPAVFVYLEDVAPDGRVTYLTEGELRAIHRKPADPATLPYDQGPAPHSFRRADALPVRPGELMTLQFALQPLAALIRKNHRLRLAVAGADANTFRRYPKDDRKPQQFLIHYGGTEASRVEVPMRPWKPDSDRGPMRQVSTSQHTRAPEDRS